MNFNDLLGKTERKKVSSREEYADSLIRRNFIEMLKKRAIEKIPVAELCEKCSINRSTFYRHYEDLYQLLDDITAEAHCAIFSDIIAQVNPEDRFEDVIYDYLLEVCTVTEKNGELYKMLLFGKTPTNLRDRMIESTYRLYELTHEGPSNFRPAKYSALHYRFLVSGLIGVWVFWVKNDYSPKKEILAKELREDLIGFYHNMSRLYGKD
ncbi:MAG: TetR/AcrR family transcriptional regulator [Lachnospiraceae bacterium]|nr:TetR/AcrR family transcriptional regulator [Lachnospiraceae bacterium]